MSLRSIFAVAAALWFPLLADAELAYTRTMSYGAVPGDRPRRLNRTWIFAERECYYPSQNLLHRYTDRQLFLDTRLRNDPRGSIASFLHDVDIAHNAGFDGIGSLDYLNVHRSQLRMMNVYPPPDGYTQMMVIPAYFKEEDLPRLREHILEVAKSPYTTRLDGKLVFWAYGGGTEGQQKWARLLRGDPSIPPFLFIGDMPFFDMYKAYGVHEKARDNPHPIPEEEVAAFRKKVMAAAETLDGFQVWHTEYYTDHFGEYPRRSGATDIYRRYLLPAALAAAEKHRARGFMLGAFVRQGYVNPFAGTTDGEYGTATLRAYLDELSLLNPDVLMGFEWNEFNENTHFQPTVAHGRTWERILAYYRALLDRDIPRPRPGDDTSVPNMVVSVRQALKLGEPWHLELLEIPDGTAPTNVQVRATLTDARGGVLLEFPEENLPTDRLVAIDYRVPSEKLAGHDAVCVTVETVYNGKRVKWDGFDCTRLHPTICRDYLYSNHPLREMLVPEDVRFSAAAGKDGMYSISAAISSPEKLSSLEILEGVQEKAAADPDGEFDRTKYVTVRGRFQTGIYSPFGPGVKSCLRGSARFRNAPNARLRAGHYAWSPFNVYGETNGVWRVGSNFTGGTGTFFAIVPKDEAEKVALDFDFPKLGKFSCDLADVVLRGRKSMRLPDSVNLELDRVEDLPDSPRPLESLHAEVSAVLPSDGRFPVWQARAITMSGRIWRSRPVCPDRKGEKMREITLFSDTERKPVKASVAESRVPDFRYDFDPRDGARLQCPSDRRFDAMLGDSNVYADYAFGARHPKGFPEGCRRLEPEWTTTAEGRRVLRFDGAGSRLVLPIEAVPHGAEYALEFEIRPDTADNQVLLRTSYASQSDCGLTVTVEGGTLRVSYFGILIVPRHFDTEAPINPRQWNSIRIEKRYEKIVCTVNGKTKSFGYDRRARRFAPVIFGGDNSPGPGIPSDAKSFKGLLRHIRVHHAVDWNDKAGGELGRWTNEVRRVEIRSTKDGTMQPSWFWAPPEASDRPVPLFVATHTWSCDLTNLAHYWGPLDWCKANGWALVCPNFRGSNDKPEGCGSDLAVQDVVDAVNWAKAEVKIDPDRVYMMGGSGGGYITLLLAGRAPEMWAGVVAWCANVDLALWHRQLTTRLPRFAQYAKKVEKSCGGTPAERADEYRRRSPRHWLARAREKGVPVYIATGVHDGHFPRGGSVPVSQSLLAFNELCRPEDRLPQSVLDYVDENEAVPAALEYSGPADPFYEGGNRILFRRTSGSVQQTLFEGGHDCNYPAGFEWLARQRRGRPADFSTPRSGKGVTEALTH